MVIDNELKQSPSNANPQNIDNPGSLSTLYDSGVGNVLIFSAPKATTAEPRPAYWRPFLS